MNHPEQALEAFEADQKGQSIGKPSGVLSDAEKAAAEAKAAKGLAEATMAAEAVAAAAHAAGVNKQGPAAGETTQVDESNAEAEQTNLQPAEQEREQRVRTEAEERAIADRDAITPKLAHIRATDQQSPKPFVKSPHFTTG